MAKLGSARALVTGGLTGIVIGALVTAILPGAGDETSDVEIANEVVGAGELVTWEPERGQICMRWGKRFQACDSLQEEPPAPIGLDPDEPPPTPLGLPRGS